MILPPDRLRDLEDSLMLFYSGISRYSSEVAAEIISNLPSKRETLLRMRAMVDDAVDILSSDRPLDDFGALLDETWALKRELSSRVSNSTIDDIYSRARKAGALGGKLLGAGEAGFMTFFVPPDRREAVRHTLKDLLHVPFAFSAQGSTVIHYDPEAYANGNTGHGSDAA